MNQLYSPSVLILLLLLPLMPYLLRRYDRTAAVKFSSTALVSASTKSWRLKLAPVITILRLICLALLIIALARPRYGTNKTVVSTKGIAMELVVDCSGSMAEQAIYQNQQTTKLQVVKNVLADFINGDGNQLKGRAGDLIGLITYATYSETLCPLVHSHKILLNFLKNIKPINDRKFGNTAIGDAIALASARLYQAENELKQRISEDNSPKASADSDEDKTDRNKDKKKSEFKIKSKVIILLTDGRQNAGEYSPVEAAELAKKWGIKIYAIGFASDIYRQSFFGPQKISASSQIDESLLRNITDITNGKYFLAKDTTSLKKIYETIDHLEKTEIESVQYAQFAEKFQPFAYAAMIILVIEILLSATIFRKIP